MRAWGCGGAPVPPPMVERAAKLWPGCHVLSLYGRSEVFLTTICRLDDPVERSVSSDGRPSDIVEMVLLDDDGKPVGPGQDGEIAQRGAGTMLGYFNDRERTAATFGTDGWCRSGDLGRVDKAGYLRVTGRSKDIIIRGGSNISAREVEDHLIAHPKVKDVALVAMPDPVLGERACAYVVPADSDAPPTLAELCTFLKEERRISVTKLPERLELIDALPMTATGKVQKFALRDRIREALKAEE
jgi:non-ribosomal peptide synthetase component E (peptide arylation enzyme)